MRHKKHKEEMRVSMSEVPPKRLRKHSRATGLGTMRKRINDLIGSVEELPSDLSSNKKKYLPESSPSPW
jgi:hypothetical protein